MKIMNPTCAASSCPAAASCPSGTTNTGRRANRFARLPRQNVLFGGCVGPRLHLHCTRDLVGTNLECALASYQSCYLPKSCLAPFRAR